MNKKTHLFAGAGAMVLLGGLRYGESCMEQVTNSIHFRDVAVDFGTPPPRFYGSRYADSYENPAPFRNGTKYLFDDGSNWEEQNRLQTARQELFEKLMSEARANELEHPEKAIAAYRQISQKGLGFTSFVTRRIGVLKDSQTAKDRSGLKEFLAATAIGVEGAPLPDTSRYAPFVKAQFAYESAWRSKDPLAFEECAKEYPDFATAEPSLIMAVRTRLGDESKHTPEDRVAAAKDLEILLAKYPGTRFQTDAIGWKGRLHYLAGDVPAALATYERQYNASTTSDQRLRVLDSKLLCYGALNKRKEQGITLLQRYRESKSANEALLAVRKLSQVLSALNGQQASAFAEELKRNPNLASTYIEIRLDHTKTTASERADVIRIGSAALAKSASGDAKALVLARLAQVSYEDDNIAAAGALARQAVENAKEGSESWALGQYLIASVDMRANRVSSAIRGYQKVFGMAPNSYFAPSAREAVAYQFDKQGRLGEALDLYMSLGYTDDVTYLLDVRMSVEEIRSYIASRRETDRNKLNYALGFRLLRQSQFAEAIAAFRNVPDEIRAKYVAKTKDSAGFDEGAPVQDPLITAKELQQLTADVSHAGGDDAKSKAMYRLASYYYERRPLTLYNGTLWEGMRSLLFAYDWNEKFAGPADVNAVRRHHYEHESLKRALDICREIVAKYPNTQVAANAAYRSATAAERLANFNPWWRQEAMRIKLLDTAVLGMQTVVDKYKSSPLNPAATKYLGVYKDERSQREKDGLY